MRVLAINSSPKMGKGNTAMILGPFLEGMEEGGANIELVYTRKLNILPCTGEYNCFLKTPGFCCQNDDMQMLYPKLRETDVLVLASPLYVNGVTGPMKNLLDRFLPLVDSSPFVVLRGGRLCRNQRAGNKLAKVVLVSSCGFWGLENFDLMVSHIESVCREALNADFAGALLRPTGRVLETMMEAGAPVGDIFEAAREAGRQLVEDGHISKKTLETVGRPVVPMEVYVEKTNELFRQALDALEGE